MTDQQAAALSQFQTLQSKAHELIKAIPLEELTREISEATAEISKLPGELAKVRGRGYAFASYLEQKVQVINEQWDAKRLEANRLLDENVNQLRQGSGQIEALVEKAKNVGTNPEAVAILLPSLESEVNALTAKVNAAKEAVRAEIAELKTEVSQTNNQLRLIHSYLDEKDEASFPFQADEKLFLTAEAEWVATGKGDKDPDGVLFLTDQRLIFEQKEKTGKKLGLFGGKHTQELEWAIPIGQIEKVEPENKGLFGGKDMLHFTLASGAPYPRITVEVKGHVKSKFWAAQIERMIHGETSDERAIPPDPELLETIRNAPTACHICEATLPAPTAGQTQIECRYCGTTIQLGG
ncbi:MAG: hypothetical protein IAE89_12660 [Anaerolineae bacterium]|nr:hypothetical protein [Anaerolineae bacterium]